MRTLVGLVSLSMVWGCASSRVQVLTALTPVDASRPFFVYKPLKGTGCGDDAIANAMEDLYRVAGDAHGFVSATIDQQLGGSRCVTITARPITYGCSPKEPKKLDVYPMHVVPGPTECAAPVDACTPECTRFAANLTGGDFETRAVRDRCLTRCRKPDAPFMTCAGAASTAADVRRCDALP